MIVAQKRNLHFLLGVTGFSHIGYLITSLTLDSGAGFFGV
jgi:hypothetical protein